MLRLCVTPLVFSVLSIATFAEQPGEDFDFTPLFNGNDLSGWHSGARFWRVEDGVLIGETSETNQASHNTVLIADKNYDDWNEYVVIAGGPAIHASRLIEIP